MTNLDSPAEMDFEERSACPVCMGTSSRGLLSLPFETDPIRSYLVDFYQGRLDPQALAGSLYELRLCADCSLVYQRWIPDEPSMRLLYGELAVADPDTVSNQRGSEVRLAYLHTIERAIRYFGGKPNDIRVLDYGAGTGLWLQGAAALGCRTAGAEFSADIQARLVAAGHESFDVNDRRCGDFHFINAEQVFEHLAEPLETARRLGDALVPGGLLRLSVPNGAGIEGRIERPDWAAPKESERSLNAVAPLEHINCFSHDSLARLGAEAGLVPFVFPLRTEIHSTARLRYAASALLHSVRPPRGTLLHFQRPL